MKYQISKYVCGVAGVSWLAAAPCNNSSVPRLPSLVIFLAPSPQWSMDRGRTWSCPRSLCSIHLTWSMSGKLETHMILSWFRGEIDFYGWLHFWRPTINDQWTGAKRSTFSCYSDVSSLGLLGHVVWGHGDILNIWVWTLTKCNSGLRVV